MKTNKKVVSVSKPKYGLIQIPIDVHTQIKNYCDKHGFKIGRLTANVMLKFIKNEN